MDWHFHWSYLLSLLHREKRYDTSASHNVLLEHLKAVSLFMFSTRQYFNPYQTNERYADQGMQGTLLDYAIEKLSDLRVPTAVEGLLALLLCLPTDFADYDSYLPKWFEIWGTIDHNGIWDCCWLMVIARARKHSKTFQWSTVLPFLLTKARDILGIPNLAGVAKVNSNSWPKGFPTFYQVILQQFKDINSKMISKLSKILFTCILSDDKTVTAGQISLTPPNLLIENMKNLNLKIPGITEDANVTVKGSINDLCQFFQAIRPLLHPSSGNNHLLFLARFVEVFVTSISKYLGERIAHKISNKEHKDNEIDAVIWNTLQYLQSLILLISLENVNSKNFVVQRVYVVCLNQLMSLNSNFIHLIVPFLVDALEPKSVTQPQRTLAALNALGSSIRTMLYPNPIALQYLPDILRLSLPGVDASDPKKTVITLELFTNIFAWVPIQSKIQLKRGHVGQYTDLLDVKDGNGVALRTKGTVISEGDFETQLECLSTYITDEWLPAFFDKIFTVIDGLEQKVKGTKESPMVSSISQCVGFVFQSLMCNSSQDGNKLLYELEDKILNYVLQSAPLTAFKVSGKLVEAIATNDASRLSLLLERILDKEVTQHIASAEKLRFRLVLAGACFRTTKTPHIVQNISAVKPIIDDKWFLHHEDAKVRKSYCKLLKDFFKGSTAIFPVDVLPVYRATHLLGEPNLPTKQEIIWNVPTAESLTPTVAILREITNQARDEIFSVLSLSNDVDAQTKLSFKRCEEILSNNLLLFVKVVRGLADITGDIASPTSSSADHDEAIMSTGRQAIMKQLSQEDRHYLLSYRREILVLLNQIHEKLEEWKEHPVYRGLRDNDYIAKQWMKSLMFTLTRRTAALKDHDGVRKWLKFQKFQNASMLVRTVYKSLQTLGGNATAALGDVNYWKFHDFNTTYIIFKIWLQHSIRASELSHAAVRIFVDANDANDPAIQSINHLMSLARHEYDSIRPQARKIFEKISSHLGHKLVKIIESTLQLLALPNATYYQTASTLVTMKQHSVMKRVAGSIELKSLFFNSLVAIQQSAANITDLDKREKVMLSLTDAMGKYASSWSHSVKDLEVFHSTIFPSLLAYFNNSSSSTTEGSGEEGNGSNQSVAGGLRFDTFLGYILLHFVSSSLALSNQNVDLRDANMKNIWQLTIRFLSQGHGLPTQHLGEALFARISEVSFVASQRDFAAVSSAEWYRTVKEGFNPVENKGKWQNLLLGLARCHPISGSEENAQWSAGIDAIIGAGEFLRIVKTRTFTSKGYEHNLCSIYFRRENVASFYSLAKAKFIDITSEESIRQFLELTKGIPTTSESEKRAVNCLAAEFFSGLLRALYDTTEPQVNQELEKVFLTYLLETIEPLSMDYCRDWEEGLFFALEGKPFPELGVIQRHILDQFNSTLKTAPSINIVSEEGVSGTPNTHVLDEGFNKQGKTLMFVIAILNADCVARSFKRENTFIVANEVIQTFLQADNQVIIAYRTSRIEIASIFTTITDHFANINNSNNQIIVGQLFDKITSEVKQVVELPDDSKMQVEDVENTEGEKSVAVNTANSGKNIVLKNTIDTILHIVPKFAQRIPIIRVGEILLSLFPALLQGVIFSEAEVARNSADSLLYIANSYIDVVASLPQYSGSNTRLSTKWIEQIFSLYDQYTSSWKIKEILVKLSVTLMVNNWFVLNDKERKLMKDLFTKGLNDIQLNVRDVSSIGMIAYLTFKTPQEMKVIAESYTRNSETLAAR